MTTQRPYSAPPFDPVLGANLAALGAVVNPTLRPENSEIGLLPNGGNAQAQHSG